MTTTITKDQITWVLTGSPVHGTYMNGDPWVVGPINIESITPVTTSVGGRKVHGSMKNVQHREMYDAITYFGNSFWQGLDSLFHHSEYDNALNVANDCPALALIAGDSIVSVESDTTATDQWTAVINRAAVLTVVAAPPAANEFRPPYWYPDRPSAPYVWSDGCLERLPRIFPASWASNIAAMVTSTRSLWLNVGHDEGRNAAQPKLFMTTYYAYRCNDIGFMFMALCSDIPNSQKRDLAHALCQIGIDYAWAVKNGQYQANTHATAMYPIIVFMSMMLGHPDFDDLDSLVRTDLRALYYGNRSYEPGLVWGERGQPFYVEETSPGVYNNGHGGFTQDMVGMPEWGNLHWCNQGVGDQADWLAPGSNNGYRECCASSCWMGIVIGLHAMGAEKMFNHNAYFDYAQRWVDEAPLHGLSVQGMPIPIQGVWNAYKPKLVLQDFSQRTIGIVPPGRPKLTVVTTPNNLTAWTIRVDAAHPTACMGMLVRATTTALRPKPNYYGAATDGLVFLDESTYEGHIVFTTNSDGTIDVQMQAIDAVGSTYTVQAAILWNGLIVTTNAIEVTIQQG